MNAYVVKDTSARWPLFLFLISKHHRTYSTISLYLFFRAALVIRDPTGEESPCYLNSKGIPSLWILSWSLVTKPALHGFFDWEASPDLFSCHFISVLSWFFFSRTRRRADHHLLKRRKRPKMDLDTKPTEGNRKHTHSQSGLQLYCSTTTRWLQRKNCKQTPKLYKHYPQPY